MDKPITIEPSEFDRKLASLWIARNEAERLGHVVRNPGEWTRRLELMPSDRPVEDAYRDAVEKFQAKTQKLESLEREKPELRHIRTHALRQRRPGPIDPRPMGPGWNLGAVAPDVSVDIAPPIAPTGEFRYGFLRSNRHMVSITSEPDDHDSTKSIEIGVGLSGADGPWESLFHRAQIKDQTHWYWFDEPDRYVYWAALGYQLPPAPKLQDVSWYFDLSHSFSLSGTAEYRLLYTKVLMYPVGDTEIQSGGATIVSSRFRDHPESLEDFTWFTGSDVTLLNDNRSQTVESDSLYGLGSTVRLYPGDVLNVWIGVYTIFSCLDGRAGTGTNELRISTRDRLSGARVPGISYVIEDPVR